MREKIFVDTGPIVAAVDARDQFHDRVVEQLKKLDPPLITNEPVITEATFLLKSSGLDSTKALGLVDSGMIQLGFSLGQEQKPVLALMRRYQNVPMSLADACLVRMTELQPRCVVWTVDSDFQIYRRNGRQVVPVLMPGKGRR
ncbi:MAG: pilus assembly protein [Verrucomicrobiales bacterium]|nr:pilus assembly protein [Verrucomicrobiales bacterium]